MRKRIAMGFLAACCLALSGCVSTLDGVWEDEARSNCEQHRDQVRRSVCNDQVDDQVREHRN